MKKNLYLAGSMCLLLASALYGGERSSANYEMPAETLNACGAGGASANYAHLGSMDGMGASSSNSPNQTAKGGFMGQLYEVVGLEVSGSATVSESGSAQMIVAQVLDDASQLAVAASSATWSVDQGPLTGVDSDGLATADIVFANTVATVQANYDGQSDTYDIEVLNTIADNYGSYANDGLGDDWQVQYFGEDNPLAAPTLDPDADGQDNAFEYTAGLIPNDPASKFTTTIALVAGQPTQVEVVFDPIVAGRSYIVKAKTDLADATWDPLTSSSVNTDGIERTVTDLAATDSSKFYIVEIALLP